MNEITLHCTGKRDIYGNVIFEGDILRSDCYPFSCGRFVDSYLALVCYDHQTEDFELYVMKAPGSAAAGQLAGTYLPMDDFYKYDFEKVGNLYTNIIIE